MNVHTTCIPQPVRQVLAMPAWTAEQAQFSVYQLGAAPQSEQVGGRCHPPQLLSPQVAVAQLQCAWCHAPRCWFVSTCLFASPAGFSATVIMRNMLYEMHLRKWRYITHLGYLFITSLVYAPYSRNKAKNKDNLDRRG
jgi:hypothetical protein